VALKWAPIFCAFYAGACTGIAVLYGGEAGEVISNMQPSESRSLAQTAAAAAAITKLTDTVDGMLQRKSNVINWSIDSVAKYFSHLLLLAGQFAIHRPMTELDPAASSVLSTPPPPTAAPATSPAADLQQQQQQ